VHFALKFHLLLFTRDSVGPYNASRVLAIAEVSVRPSRSVTPLSPIKTVHTRVVTKSKPWV